MLEFIQAVALFGEAHHYAAGEAGGKIGQRSDLAYDQVGLVGAGALVDHAADDHDGVGLDEFIVGHELLGPAYAADHVLGVFQVEHGVARGPAGIGALGVLNGDGRDQAAQHHLCAMLQGGGGRGGVRTI